MVDCLVCLSACDTLVDLVGLSDLFVAAKTSFQGLCGCKQSFHKHDINVSVDISNVILGQIHELDASSTFITSM